MKTLKFWKIYRFYTRGINNLSIYLTKYLGFSSTSFFFFCPYKTKCKQASLMSFFVETKRTKFESLYLWQLDPEQNSRTTCNIYDWYIVTWVWIYVDVDACIALDAYTVDAPSFAPIGTNAIHWVLVRYFDMCLLNWLVTCEQLLIFK